MLNTLLYKKEKRLNRSYSGSLTSPEDAGQVARSTMNGGSGLWIRGSTSGGASEKTINSSLMLKFRPIAPKPADGKFFSSGKPPEIIKKVVVKRRTNRKCVRVRKSKNTNSSGKNSPAVTLQLMPEKNESPKSPDEGSARDMSLPTLNSEAPETSQHASNASIMKNFLQLPEHEIINETSSIMETVVTIESMKDAYVETVGSLGSNDSDILRNLQVDTCPGFVTGRFNKVGLVNDAFVRLVSGDEAGDGQGQLSPGVAVRLVVREEPPPWGRRAFTCLVKINYNWKKEKCPKMVPCDGWRLDGGGFAWRLDLKAALGLGF